MNVNIKNIMQESLSYRRCIYGIMAIWIVMFHLSNARRLPISESFIIIGTLIRTGNVCVDIFLFLSGYCICKSWQRSGDIKYYFIHRFRRIIVPYLILSLPFYAWKWLIEQRVKTGGGQFYVF